MDTSSHETDVHDPSLEVIRALGVVDVEALSYVQLRRLHAALVAATKDVDDEIAKRSQSSTALGETVRIESPRKPTRKVD